MAVDKASDPSAWGPITLVLPGCRASAGRVCPRWAVDQRDPFTRLRSLRLQPKAAAAPSNGSGPGMRTGVTESLRSRKPKVPSGLVTVVTKAGVKAVMSPLLVSMVDQDPV